MVQFNRRKTISLKEYLVKKKGHTHKEGDSTRKLKTFMLFYWTSLNTVLPRADKGVPIYPLLGFTKDSIDAINLLSFNRSNIPIYSQLTLSA